MSVAMHELPVLAVDAALELDEISRGATLSGSATHLLTEWLRDGFAGKTHTDVDPSLVMLLHRAWVDAGLPRVSQVDELIGEVERLTERLTASPMTVDDASALRGFCVSLSRVSSASQLR